MKHVKHLFLALYASITLQHINADPTVPKLPTEVWGHIISLSGTTREKAQTATKLGLTGLRRSMAPIATPLREFADETAVALANFNNPEEPLNIKAFRNLFIHGHAFPEATEAALTNIINYNDTIMWYRTLRLLGELFNHGHALQEVTNEALTKVNHDDINVRYKAILLFEEVVKCGHALQEATEAALANINHDNSFVRYHALILFEKLVKHGHILQEATEAALANINDDNDDVRRAALNLQQALIAQGVAI